VPIGFLGIPLGWILVALVLAGGFGAFVVVSSVGAKRS
jgi:TRAP-type C4-dicarboxylate transport system permease small subunit